MRKEEIRREVLGVMEVALGELDRALKTRKAGKFIADRISEQIRGMHWLGCRLFTPLVEEASFDLLCQAADKLPFSYYVWVLLHFKPEILETYFKKFDDIKTLKAFETAVHASRALNCESANDWWWWTFEKVSVLALGNLSTQRLFIEPRLQPDFLKNIHIFNYGEFQPFKDNPLSVFFSGVRTPESEEGIVKAFITKKWNYPLNLKDLLKDEFLFGSRYNSLEDRYDRTANYMVNIFEGITELTPYEALRRFFDGSLRNKTAKRGSDRMKNVLTSEQQQKRGGRSLKEIGQTIKRLREDKGMTRAELASIVNRTEGYIEQIEEGRLSRIFPSRILSIANILEADVNTIIGGKQIIHTHFQEELEDKGDDEPRVKSVQVAYGDILSFSPEEKSMHRDSKAQLLKSFPRDSIEHRVLKHHLEHLDTGITQEEFANRIKISTRHVRRITGHIKADPHIKSLLKNN